MNITQCRSKTRRYVVRIECDDCEIMEPTPGTIVKGDFRLCANHPELSYHKTTYDKLRDGIRYAEGLVSMQGGFQLCDKHPTIHIRTIATAAVLHGDVHCLELGSDELHLEFYSNNVHIKVLSDGSIELDTAKDFDEAEEMFKRVIKFVKDSHA